MRISARLRKHVRCYLDLVMVAGLAGCASTVLNMDTRDIAGSVVPLYQDQVLENLGRMASDPYAMPSEVDLKSGTVQTAYGLSPSLTIPFGNTVARGGAGSITAVTDPYRSLSLGGSMTRQDSWIVAPVTDPTRLRNTVAVYRYVLRGHSDGCRYQDLACRKSHDKKLKTEYQVPLKYEGTKLCVDLYYLLQPQCVLCLNPRQLASLGDNRLDYSLNGKQDLVAGAIVNPDVAGFEIHAENPGTVLTDTVHSLGQHGGHVLWMSADDFNAGRLSRLLLLLFPLDPPGKAGTS